MGFRWGLPEYISTYGDGIDRLNIVLHWFMLALFVGWGGWMAWCLFKYRARAGHKATYEPIHGTTSKYLEVGVAIFEGFLLVGLSMPVWAAFKSTFPDRAQATEIRIIGQQFAWNFHYPGVDGQFGKTDPKFTDNSNPVGLDPEDPHGVDDIVYLNTLHYPANRPLIATISSKDVIHSFGVPALRIKQDAMPGMAVPIWFETTPKLIEEAMLQGGGTSRDVIPFSAFRGMKTEPPTIGIVANGADVRVSVALGEAGAGVSSVKAGDFLEIAKNSSLAAGGKNTGLYRVTGVEGNDILAKKIDGTAETVAAVVAAGLNDVVVRTDEFDIACSQLCGINHYRMKAILSPDSETEYAAFIAENTPEAAKKAGTP